ncbi:DUF3630 family protein [Hymenobacter caeli]|uniref:DUF3630 family protein n=1 Tax=Hymenobacter caeli TaxID=2735894 RepID=A0ABX2FT78_9BACT|nr:DUF3630 family protein [Hymenobacter caeli]NRT20386.1 hypothetical protein [Hymenobacter caeli]
MIKIDKANGYNELIIEENCDYNLFYNTADKLEAKFNVEFINKLDGLDTAYWIFRYESALFVLHYNIYSGVSMYPENLEKATDRENHLINGFLYRW